MVVTNEEIADKIVYLKDNHYMPNIDNETSDVQLSIRSFYNGEKTNKRGTDKVDEDPFWFKLTFTNYQVTDEFVREINRKYKLFQIKNIGKNET